MQQRHFSSGMFMTSRFRLPLGFAELRDDLGPVLRRLRIDEGLTQADLAQAVGISRESVSRIERSRAVPRPEVLEAMLAHLWSDWGAVAIPGAAGRPPMFFDGTSQGDQRHELGCGLRAGRKRLKLSLRQVSELCGISAAQLSRIERGEGVRSSAYECFPEDEHMDRRERRVRFAHPVLAGLAS
jgi:transcriptional regulator with XRE-family HTH domain